MPVRIRAKYRYKGSVQPSDLNTETDIISLDAQDDDFILEGYIDLSQLASGDTVVLRLYVAVDGANRKLMDRMTIYGPIDPPIVRIPAHTFAYDMQPRITITQTTGIIRQFPYYFLLQLMEVV